MRQAQTMESSRTTTVARSRFAAAMILALLAVALVAGEGRAAGAETVAVEVESARWESGYGAKFFQVVGKATNKSDRPLGAVQVHVDVLAGDEVVAGIDCWNGRAEVLEDLRGDAAQKKLAEKRVEPIAPGGFDRFRCTVLDEDAPGADGQRARVAATLPAP